MIRVNLDRYHFLPYKERARIENPRNWGKAELRIYVMKHIAITKRKLGRNHMIWASCDMDSYSEHNLFWIIWDLEALGRPGLAEKAYVALIKMGAIKPV